MFIIKSVRTVNLFPKHAVGLYLRDGWALLKHYAHKAFHSVRHLVALELQVVHKLSKADALQGPCHRSTSNSWLSEGSQVPVPCLCPVTANAKDSTCCPEEELFSSDSDRTLVLSSLWLTFPLSAESSALVHGLDMFCREVSPALLPRQGI
jgi:hypothetical protein